VGTVTDQHGRTGTAVAVTIRSEGPRGGSSYEERLIFDPNTGRPLATESRIIEAHGEFGWLAKDTLFRYTLVQTTGWTDEAPPPANG
jgi:hypothetical protein